MTTLFEEMKSVLRDSGRFTEEQIAQLFSDAHVGRHSRYSHEDDERPWCDDDDDDSSED